MHCSRASERYILYHAHGQLRKVLYVELNPASLVQVQFRSRSGVPQVVCGDHLRLLAPGGTLLSS